MQGLVGAIQPPEQLVGWREAKAMVETILEPVEVIVKHRLAEHDGDQRRKGNLRCKQDGQGERRVDGHVQDAAAMAPDTAVCKDVAVLEDIVAQEMLDLEGAEQQKGAEFVQVCLVRIDTAKDELSFWQTAGQAPRSGAFLPLALPCGHTASIGAVLALGWGMGWRDINMSRRKPLPRVAVVVREAGQDHASAVLHKAAAAARVASLAQLQQVDSFSLPFVAGYVAGHARHQALRHGVDAENSARLMQALLAALAVDAPQLLAESLKSLQFRGRDAGVSSRCVLQAGRPAEDAGYLVGQLESLCGTRYLLAAALDCASGQQVAAYLTLCDQAADRLQTHQPTARLRFDEAERAVVRAALQD